MTRAIFPLRASWAWMSWCLRSAHDINKVPADFKAQSSIITFSLHQREKAGLSRTCWGLRRRYGEDFRLRENPLDQTAQDLAGADLDEQAASARPISRIDSSQRTADGVLAKERGPDLFDPVSDAASALLMRGSEAARGEGGDEGSGGLFCRGPCMRAQVRRHADGGADELSRRGSELLDGPVHGGARAGDDDLAGGVEVGGLQDSPRAAATQAASIVSASAPRTAHHFSVSGGTASCMA